MLKRWMSVLMALAMVFQLCGTPVVALDVSLEEEDSSVATGIDWSVSDGVLTISGSGPMEDYVYDESNWSYNTPWINYAYDITEVVIEDGVTSIGANAFGGMYYLAKITLGKDVASISEGVFSDCAYSLTTIEVSPENSSYCCVDNVLFNYDKTELIRYVDTTERTAYTVPATVKKIGCGAFQGVNYLTSVTLPEGLQVIGDYAFRCTSLTSLSIPNSVKTIGDCAFADLYKLTSVKIGSGVTSLGQGAFRYCNRLTELTVDEDNTAYCVVDGVLFDKDKTELLMYLSSNTRTSYEIPESVRTIGGYAFYSCSNLTSVSLPSGLETIGENAFFDCAGLAALALPNGLKTIGDSAFYYCSSLAKADLPDGLTTLGQYAFSNTALTSVTIPDGVTTIGASAFSYAPLVEATIGDGVTEIGYRAFSGCTSLETVTFLGDAPEVVGEYAFSSVKATCYYPQNNDTWTGEAMAMFDSGLTWEMTSYEIAFGTCGDGVTWSMTDLGTLTISGKGDMTSCPWKSEDHTVKRVIVEDGVTSVCDSAFDGYTELKKAVLADSVTKLGPYAFYRCSALESVDLGAGVRNIGSYAFCGCTSLKRIVIAADVSNLGSYAFSDCDSLSEIYLLGNSPASYFPDTFGQVALNATVYYISEYWRYLSFEAAMTWERIAAYGTCGDDLTWRVSADGTVLTIEGTGNMDDYASWTGNYAPWYSDYADQIVQLDVLDGVTSIGMDAFWCCEKLTWAFLADSVKLISMYAFQNCYALKEVTIPDGVTGIADRAFQNCYALEEITIPSGMTSIGYYVFQNCDALTSVTIPENITYLAWYAFADCDRLAEVKFLGAAPSIATTAFDGVIATCYYPADDESWTDAVFQNYGGTLTWVASDGTVPEDPVPGKVEWASTACDADSIRLVWNAMDKIGGYVLQRASDASFTTDVKEFTPVENSYDDTDVGHNRAYYYRVRAVSVSGETYGDWSESVCITFLDREDPEVERLTVSHTLCGGTVHPTIEVAASDSLCMARIQLNWVREDGTVGVILDEVPGTQTSYTNSLVWNVSGLASGTYSVKVTVTDTAGNTDELVQKGVVVDNTAPDAPGNLTVTEGQLKNTLSWSRSTEAGTTTKVYRALAEDGERVLLASVNEDKDVYNAYVDADVVADTTYYYWVAAVDALGNESDVTGPVAGSVKPDTTAPEIRSIEPVNGTLLTGTVTFCVVATDNIRVKSIAMACSADGEQWTDAGVVETTGSAYFNVDTTVYPGEKLYLKLTVLDICGNETVDESTYSYGVDNTAPEQVSGLTAAVSSTTITLNWDDVTAQDFACFVVEQLVGETYQQIGTVKDALGIYLTGMEPDTAYTYRVYAVDKCGNKGVPSESLTVTTVADTTAPVISNIAPQPGTYNASIPMRFTVSDDQGVHSLLVEVSVNGEDWSQVAEVSVQRVGTSITVAYDLDTTKLDEGLIYVRAVAVDQSGNKSDSSNAAPYCQYKIDRTAPAAPTGLTAEPGAGKIALSWVQGSESDLGTYTVYRATAADGTYTTIASGLEKLSWLDSGLEYGATYYYRIDVTDQVGNRSGYSDVVSCTVPEDTTAPQVVSVSPSDGYVLGATTAIQVKVWDNNRLKALYYQVSTDGGETWQDAASVDLSVAEQVVKLPVIQESIDTGFRMKFWCEDVVGQISETVYRSYGVDKTAPAAPSVTAVVKEAEWVVELSWPGGAEDDLAGYRVYRTVAGGTARLLTQKSGGAESYTYTDDSVSAGVTYTYYVEAVDARGNVAKGAITSCTMPELTEENDRVAPVAVLDGSAVGAAGYEISFSAERSTDNLGIVSYLWDFGDGTTSSAMNLNHAFQSVGIYTVTLTVTDAAGNKSSASLVVTVRDPEAMGTLKVTVLDESGQAVANAGVYVDLGSEDMSVVYTGSNGVVEMRVEAGTHDIGIYKEGYLPAQKSVSVAAGSTESLTVSVIEREIVVGELTVERMTLEQIKAAGIDVSDPANQQVYEFVISLTYGTEEYILSGAYNGDGDVIVDPDPIEINEEDEIRKLCVQIFPVTVGGGSGSGGGSGGTGGSGAEDTEVPMVVVLDIPGTATWLKDFFDVRLTVFNQADVQFVLDDCVAYLNVPGGLTLMDTNRTTSNPKVDMGSMEGQTSATAEWIIRGDVAGYYDLTADFSAVLRDFNAAVNAQFKTAEPFQVRQGDDLVLEVVVENAIIADTDGAVRVGLRNDNEYPYYLPNVQLDENLVDLVDNFKTNGRVVLENADMEVLSTGETIWWDYIIPRENWDVLTKRSGEDFYLLDAIVKSLGGTTELESEIEEVMPFSINGDLIVVTRLSDSGAESDISYVNIRKDSLSGASVPSLAIRTYRKNKVTQEYEPCSMKVTIKDGYIIDTKDDVGEEGITVTTNANGYYRYDGYTISQWSNSKSYNIRISASRAKPVEIPVVVRGSSATTGLLTIYAYTGSGDDIEVLEGVNVTIMEADDSDASGTTDKDGKIVFKRVDQGYQELIITKDGYLPLRELVQVGEDTEYSFRMVEDDDPTATRILQVTNTLSDYTKGNQTVIPEGCVTGTVSFTLTKRMAEGETFQCYHYRIVAKDGTVREKNTFNTDNGFWLKLADLKAGDTLEFAVESTNGKVSAYMDSNLVVIDKPDFLNGLVYDMTKIQYGGSIDTSSAVEFDPFATIQTLFVSQIAQRLAVEDDENGHKAALVEYLNQYVFSNTEVTQKFPLSAKYELSGKLTLSVICGGSAKTTTKSGSTYGIGGMISGGGVTYASSVEISQATEYERTNSGQVQLDFVFQYMPEKDDWSLTVYLSAGASQKLVDKDATFFYVLYVAGEVELKEEVKLELVQTKVGPGETTKLLQKGLVPDSFKAEGEAKVSGGLTIVNRKLASVGVYAKAGLEFQFLPYWALTAKAAVGAEGNVLIWKTEKDLVSGEWEASGDTSVAAQAFNLLEDDETVLYLAKRTGQDAGWQGNDGVEQWITDAYVDADVQLATLNDGSVLAVWCDYTGYEGAPLALYWSVCSAGKWSEPALVDNDGTADLYPNLIETEDGAQLVWVDFSASVAGMTAMTQDEIRKKAYAMLDVSTASYVNGTWSDAVTVSVGGLAAEPRVASGDDGTVLVSWIANAAGMEEGSRAYPDSVGWALVDAKGNVTERGSVAAPYANISDLGLGYEYGYQMSVLAKTESGEMKVLSCELVGAAWTDLDIVNGVSGEDTELAVSENGVIYTINSGRLYATVNGKAHHLLHSDYLDDSAGDLSCAETTAGTVLLWTCMVGANRVICMSLVDDEWNATAPVLVENSASGILASPVATERGAELLVMFQRSYMENDTWVRDVEMRTVPLGVDLSLEECVVQHSTHLVPGVALETYVEVSSLGVVTPKSFTAEIYTVRNGVETVVAAGVGTASLNLTIQWVVPEDYAGETVYLRVVHEEDCDPNNNVLQLENLVVEMEVSGATYVGRMDGKDIFTVDVENQGLVASDATVLHVRAMGSKEILLEQQIASLAAGAKCTVRLELEALDRSEAISLVFELPAMDGEENEGNNQDYVYLDVVEHTYNEGQFRWAADFSSAIVCYTCSQCGQTGSDECRVSCTSEDGRLIFVATGPEQPNGVKLVDTKIIELELEEDTPVLRLPMVDEDVAARMKILIAAYDEEGRMTDVQEVEVLEEEIPVLVKGHLVKVFFLDRETGVPLFTYLSEN